MRILSQKRIMVNRITLTVIEKDDTTSAQYLPVKQYVIKGKRYDQFYHTIKPTT